MGLGSVANHRWHKTPTPAEQATYWQNAAMQLKAERDHWQRTSERLDRTNQTLAINLSNANRLLAAYRLAYGPILDQGGEQ